jgi:multidrug resistance protein, MATE family
MVDLELPVDMDSGEKLPSMWDNFLQIHSSAIPCLVSCVISEMQLELNLIFIGNYSEDTFMLAGVGMANMIINVGCMSIVYGMTSVLETLVSQAHGSKQYYMCGVFFNKALVLIFALFVPVTLLMCNAEQLLLLLGQDPAVSLYAGRLLRYQLPGIYMQAIDEALALFFTALEKNYIMLIIDSFRIPMHLALLYIFVVKLDWEIFGCAMAVNLVYFMKFVMTKFVVDYYKKTMVDLRESFFFRIDEETFKEYRAFLKLATAGLLLSCLEWWIGEAMTLMGGYIDVDS